jgi:hypothetical protein
VDIQHERLNNPGRLRMLPPITQRTKNMNEPNQYWKITKNGAARVMWGTETQAREYCAAIGATYAATK